MEASLLGGFIHAMSCIKAILIVTEVLQADKDKSLFRDIVKYIHLQTA